MYLARTHRPNYVHWREQIIVIFPVRAKLKNFHNNTRIFFTPLSSLFLVRDKESRFSSKKNILARE